jgi:DNA-directed RNA polymerase specialized sigma24 family protein
MKRLPLNVVDLAREEDFEQIVAFDEAICRLEEETPTGAAVVRLRFYAGLSVQETAGALGVSSRTVDREWTYARAWLFRLLEENPGKIE